MQCKRCGNEDPRYFYWHPLGLYCRKCITFKDDQVENWKISAKDVDEYTLGYQLSDKQKEIAYKCAREILNHDVLLKCVCGAGKTEMVLNTIAYQLAKKKVIGFAIPRCEVVKELSLRLKSIFKKAKVVAVYGGHSDCLKGDIVVCTTHQLYRYDKIFNVLILDEPDAYPFNNNDLLWSFAERACLGHFIFLSATPNERIMKRNNLCIFRLDQRPHGKPLPVPKIRYGTFVKLVINFYFWWQKRKNKPVMLFLPTILLANNLYCFLHLFINCALLTSKTKDKDQVLQAFKQGSFNLLLCTTIMERGVTIPGVDVCVLCAEHNVFDVASLIQIAGRVGRKKEYPSGSVLFMCRRKSLPVLQAIDLIKESNALSFM